MTTGYGAAVEAWTAAGWRGVLPLPARSKTPPPSGYTGANGAWPTDETVAAWAATGAANAALRLPDGVIGVDVDAYNGKIGAETLGRLEARCGPLPDTWTITSRSDGISGIRLYRTPLGIGWRGEAGPGVEVIQHRHRYLLIPPSIHPEGREYLLIGPGGELGDRPPTVDELPALPTAWVEALREPVAPPAPDRPRPAIDAGPLDRYKARATVDDVRALLDRLGAHTWRPVGDLWHCTRPGKPDGTSAVVGLGPGRTPGNTVHVHTSAWPGLPSGTYTASDLLVIIHGDPTTAARAVLEAEGWRAPNNPGPAEEAIRSRVVNQPTTVPDDGDAFLLAQLINWTDWWTHDQQAEEWLIYPLIPAKRAVAIYAPGKTGKSLLTLAAIVDAISGRPVLGTRVARPDLVVLYLDYEMTDADLRERLEDMGCDETTDLSRLRYASLPSLPPLDTADGAQSIVRLAQLVGAHLVVVDTFGRAVEGDENDADTVRSFYRHTGLALKSAGVAVTRIDHAGKDPGKGQRGTSAKNDDVDIVWRLERVEGGLRAHRTHSRVRWVPERVSLIQVDDPNLGFVVEASPDQWPAGTKELADLLDRLGVPSTDSARQASAALRDHGAGVRAAKVRAAQKYRAMRDQERGPASRNTGRRQNTSGSDAGADSPGRGTPETAGDLGEQSGTRSRTHRDAPDLSPWDAPPPYRADAVPGPDPDAEEKQW